MTEPVTTIGLGAIVAYLGKDGLEKLLGPTADYLGCGMRDLAQRRIDNIGKIFQKAKAKLAEKIEEPGEVPPRVLKSILDEGSYCDNEIAAEYFGGVLASSRTKEGRDDRGARIVKIIEGLSTYQLRTHYLIYSTIKTVFSSSGLSLNLAGRPQMKIFFPIQSYLDAMAFSPDEAAQAPQIVLHVFFGLHAEGLIENEWKIGPKESIAQIYPEAEGMGIVCQPSALGAEMFLWAFLAKVKSH